MFYRTFIAIFLSANLFAQGDTIQNIEQINVSYLPTLKLSTDQLITKRIQEMAAEDAAELIRKFAGVSLKSYGGLGGLKTISMRGLGTNHSSIVSDGFAISNNQTGQVNLGQIQADNITNVISVLGKSQRFIQPISSQIAGSAFLFETFENSFSHKKMQLRTSIKYGSFDQKSGYLGVKYSPSKFLVSIYGQYREANGKYPYTFKNGTFDISDTRQNNDYQDYNFGITTGFKNEKLTTRLGYKRKSIDQGLPGAVIFYNQTQDERLNTKEDAIFGDLVFVKNKFHIRAYSNGSVNKMNYFDPTYFNSVGKMDVDYNNRSLTAGVSINQKIKQKWEVFGGTEEIISDLKTNDSTFALPVRFHNFSLLGARFKLKIISLEAEVSSQYVVEKNNHGVAAKDRFRLNPFFNITGSPFGNKLVYEVWYRNSFRMPTFNELYYNNIGNNLLEPEDAHQFNVGLTYLPTAKQFTLKVKANGFYNRVENKIVAIPTQNLFVWSIQNVGKSNIYGAELFTSIDWRFNSNWKLTSDANYSFQKTIDITDQSSPTYKDQIAYIPIHSGNFDVAVYFKNTGLSLISNFIGSRYALNENIDANLIDGFYLIDAGIFHQFEIREKHKLKLQLNIKNITNNSYAYIRSFAMPGINYLISLNYAFN